MPRRMSPSQLKSKLRQLEQKRRQAVQKYNQEVRRYNQKQKSAIAQFNREVRTYNARVRADQNRLRSEVNKLNSRPAVQRKTVIRASVRTVTQSYDRLIRYYPGDTANERLNEFLDLSEREAANAVGLLNAFEGDETETSYSFEESASVNAQFLRSVSQDLADRWSGAIYSLNPNNPDAARHFCTSVREVFTQIIEIHANDADVWRFHPDCETHEGKPNRRAKVGFLFARAGVTDGAIADFADVSISDVLTLFRDLNSGTHGKAGKFTLAQLHSLRKRTEDTMDFLRSVIAG